jgi:hypothetical protein
MKAYGDYAPGQKIQIEHFTMLQSHPKYLYSKGQE